MLKLWITWEKQRRNSGISAELEFYLHEIISDEKGFKRYFDCIKRTIFLIYKSRPSHVAVQNPSIVLALLAVILKGIFRYILLVDSHNAGITPQEGKNLLLNLIAKIIQKTANCTIVSNNSLKDIVENNGGVAYVLPDKIPKSNSSPQEKEVSVSPSVFFICTYANDEPYENVIDAAKQISDDILILFTGDYSKKVDPKKVPNNVKLLGYISENDYWATMMSSDVVMDLTLREDCLVCGAYEGLSIKKPLILSNTKVNRSYFYKGCIYVNSDTNSIALGILDAFEKFKTLHRDIYELKNELESKWIVYSNELKSFIDSGHT